MTAERSARGSRRQPGPARRTPGAITRLRWWDGAGLRSARVGVKGIEIQEVLRWDPYLRKDDDSLTLAYGSTGHGRLLVVVLRRTGPRDLRVVAARDMTERERDAYQRRPR